MTGFEYDNVDGDEWAETPSDPVHGREDVPRSYKRTRTILGVETTHDADERFTPLPDDEIARIGIGVGETTDRFITSDTWYHAEDMV